MFTILRLTKAVSQNGGRTRFLMPRSLAPESGHWTDTCRSTSRYTRRDESHHREEERHDRKDHGIARAHAEQQAGRGPDEVQSTGDTNQNSRRGETHSVSDDQAPHFPWRG